MTETSPSALRDRFAAAFRGLNEGGGTLADLDDEADVLTLANAALAVLSVPAACPDPIECSHEAALGETRARIERLALAFKVAGNEFIAERIREALGGDAASGPGRADDKPQQDETQAPYPPSVEWHTETQRRGDYWSSWSCVRYELAEAQSAFAETVKHDRGRHAWRLIRETTTYAVEAEQPAVVPQPDGEA